jgi:serine phosphatase RsbU (regulator of sigma subunit)
MEYSSKAFARKILAVHGLLFVAVLGLVFFASRGIYHSARNQAIKQSTVQQELLATQTSRGIEDFYASIIADLDLLRRADAAETASTQAATLPATTMAATPVEPLGPGEPPGFAQGPGGPGGPNGPGNPGGTGPAGNPGRNPGGPGGPGFGGQNPGGNNPGRAGGGPNPGRGNQGLGALALGGARERVYFPILWNQLSGRVTALFVYDRQAPDLKTAVRLIEPRSAVDTRLPSPQVTDELQHIVSANREWLTNVRRPSVGPLIPTQPKSQLVKDDPDGSPNTGGINLVCVPPLEGDRFVLVAVVPASIVQNRSLPQDADRRNTDAIFLDDHQNIVASTTPNSIGRNLAAIDDPVLNQMNQTYAAHQRRETQAFEQGTTIDGNFIPPRLVTVQPVAMPQAKWLLLVTSPMSDADAVVSDLFKTSLFWAIFVVISMTAILLSTAVQMIRSRVRIERIRHDLLTRELSQARQIQLNWLPNRHSAGPALDIAAINQPASHISGDFYNWFDLPDGRQVITIGDVTGHGMAAAFLMATTQLLVRTTMPRVADAGQCMEEVNRQLCTQVFHGQFVTMLIVVLDLEQGMMEVATAGHAGPLISQAGEPFAPLKLKSQLVLAVDDKQTYATERFKLKLPSNILLYTDGVVDVQSETGSRLEAAGFRGLLNRKFDSAQSMIDHIVAQIAAFRGKRALGDDLTLVAIQVKSALQRKEDAHQAMEQTAAQR